MSTLVVTLFMLMLQMAPDYKIAGRTLTGASTNRNRSCSRGEEPAAEGGGRQNPIQFGGVAPVKVPGPCPRNDGLGNKGTQNFGKLVLLAANSRLPRFHQGGPKRPSQMLLPAPPTHLV